MYINVCKYMCDLYVKKCEKKWKKVNKSQGYLGPKLKQYIDKTVIFMYRNNSFENSMMMDSHF